MSEETKCPNCGAAVYDFHGYRICGACGLPESLWPWARELKGEVKRLHILLKTANNIILNLHEELDLATEPTKKGGGE